jgi:hypothetical protein
MSTRKVIPIVLVSVLLMVIAAPAKNKDKVQFEGLIETLPVGLLGDWVIGGRIVHVSAATNIKQDHGIVAGLDVFVEVKGSLLPNSSINATEIEVKAGPGAVHQAKFSGFVNKLPNSGLIGDWAVDGRAVHVSNTTDIKMERGLVTLNAFVEIKGFLEEDGSVTADDITVDAAPGSTHEFDFENFVEKLPSAGLIGDWTTNERTVHVDGATKLKQGRANAALNAFVKVKGLLLADGMIRASEIEVEAAPGSSHQFDFKGFVDKLPDDGLIGDWVIDGRTVHVGGNTHVHQEQGIAAENAFVRVAGLMLGDGSIDAKDLHVEASPLREGRISLQGFVDQLPLSGLVGDWIVSGRTVHVSVDTRIKLKNSLVITVGSLVKVNGFLNADGTVTAGKIKLKL